MATGTDGIAVPGSYVYNPPAGTILNPGTQTLAVTFTPTDTTTIHLGVRLSFVDGNGPRRRLHSRGPSTTPPGSQPTVTFTLINPYPVDLTAVFTLTFVGSGTPSVDDPAVQFQRWQDLDTDRACQFNHRATHPAAVGNGCRHNHGQLATYRRRRRRKPPGLQPVVIDVPNAVPAVKTRRSPAARGQLTVTVQGFSNTRELTFARFEFTAVPGAPAITTPDVSVPVGTIFADWFASPIPSNTGRPSLIRRYSISAEMRRTSGQCRLC